MEPMDILPDPDDEKSAPPAADGNNLYKRLIDDFFASRIATISLIGIVLIVLCAVFAPWIAPTNPYDLATVDVLDSRLPPGSKSTLVDFTYMLGSDGLGRDILSAIFYGLRTSFLVGFLSGFLGCCLGSAVGIFSAYAGGRVDTIIMRIVDLQLSFPTILIALVLMATLGQGVEKIILALVITQWAYFARAVRGAALVERRKEYMEAAACLGLSHFLILRQQLLPNCLPPLQVL